MHLEMRYLRAVRAIHEAGGLSKVADIINPTQSALSHQIRGLEDQGGTDLFVRLIKPTYFIKKSSVLKPRIFGMKYL